MNKCFIIGKIITEIEFKLALSKKIYSASNFKVKTKKDNQEIIIEAYNKQADYCFKNLKCKNVIILEGYLKSNYVVAEKLQKIN